MTARPVAHVIPAASRGRRQPGKPGAGRPMPLASPPGRPDVVYGFGCIDASGRVADRVTIAALGWRGGDRLTLTAEAGVMVYVKAHVVARRNARGGRSATEHLVAALRCLYKHAEDDGLITQADNPARKVDKPRRLPSTRRAVAGRPAGRDQPGRRDARAMTRSWTRCCCGCTPRPPAAAAARWRCGRGTWTRTSA